MFLSFHHRRVIAAGFLAEDADIIAHLKAENVEMDFRGHLHLSAIFPSGFDID